MCKCLFAGNKSCVMILIVLQLKKRTVSNINFAAQIATYLPVVSSFSIVYAILLTRITLNIHRKVRVPGPLVKVKS